MRSVSPSCRAPVSSRLCERHEAMRELSRARQAAKKDLQGKRQQISSLMLRLGRYYPGKKTWGPAHMTWLMSQKLEYREQRMVLEELLQGIRQEGERVERLEGDPRGGTRMVACRGRHGPAGDARDRSHCRRGDIGRDR